MAEWPTNLPDEERFRLYHHIYGRLRRSAIMFGAVAGTPGDRRSPDGTPSAVYEGQGDHREFVAVVKQYQPLKPIGAYLKDTVPTPCRREPHNCPKTHHSTLQCSQQRIGAPLQGIFSSACFPQRAFRRPMQRTL